MVKRLIGVISKEIHGLHQAAYLLAFFAIMSQLLALVRDRLLAHFFGASQDLDIYYAAFRIPDFIFLSVASMVSIAVLVPFLVEKIENGKEEGKRFVDTIFSFFFIVMLVIAIAFFLLMPFILSIVFPGFTGDSYDKLLFLTRLLLLSPILLGLSNFFASIVQVYNRFLIYAISPLVYNISIIGGILLISPRFGIIGVVIGVIVGAFLHFAIQIPFVSNEGLLPSFKWKWDWITIKKVFNTSFPRTLTLGINHISLIFLISLASLMVAGSISVFNLSFNMQSLPLTVIAVSYSSAAFPVLSKLFNKKEVEAFKMQIIDTAKHIIFWILPITALFIVLRAQIVRTVLGSGQFSWEDTRLTAAALAIFSISAVFQGLILLFVRAFYAQDNTRKPFIINFFSSFLIIFFAYCFTKFAEFSEIFRLILERVFRVEGIMGTEVLMLPLGYSLGTIINALLLLYVLNKDISGIWKGIYNTFFEIFLASFVIGFVSYNALNFFDTIFNLETLTGIFLQGFLSGLLGIIFGIFVLVGFQNPEIKTIITTFRKRFWGIKTITTDSDI